MAVQVGVGEFLHDLSDEEGDAGPEVAEGLDSEVVWPVAFEELSDAGWCEAPEVAVGVGRAYWAHRRGGDEEQATWPHGREAVLDASARSAQEVQRLGEDDAVVGVRRQRADHFEVRDERRSGVRGIDATRCSGRPDRRRTLSCRRCPEPPAQTHGSQHDAPARTLRRTAGQPVCLGQGRSGH